jgi:hypothetical protein
MKHPRERDVKAKVCLLLTIRKILLFKLQESIGKISLILQSLKSATEIMSTDSCTSLSMVVPAYVIMNHLEQLSSGTGTD